MLGSGWGILNFRKLKEIAIMGKLKEFNSVIQVCSECGKIDVYKNDGHTCNRGKQESREEEQECGD